MRLPVLVVFLAAWTSATASAEVVSVTPIRDNTLFEDAEGDTSNGAGPVFFAGNNGQGLARRAVLMFDVTSGLPSGAAIDSVVLTLTVSNAPNTVPRQFTLHRLLRDWGEGSSYATGGGGAPAAAGDATWVHAFYPAQPWSAAGGDFDAAVSATLLLPGTGRYAWRGAGMTADVQAWRSDPGTNHGWLVQGEENSLNTARRFESREAAEPADRPALNIYYTHTTAARFDTWGSIKARYR